MLLQNAVSITSLTAARGVQKCPEIGLQHGCLKDYMHNKNLKHFKWDACEKTHVVATTTLTATTMKTPERSRTSRVPPLYSPFAQKSFCLSWIERHTQMQGHRSNGSVVRVRTDTHTHTNGSDSMTSTADAGGNKCKKAPVYNRIGALCLFLSQPRPKPQALFLKFLT